jgi:hypothetical protein
LTDSINSHKRSHGKEKLSCHLKEEIRALLHNSEKSLVLGVLRINYE